MSLSTILNPTPVVTETLSTPAVSLHTLVDQLMLSFIPLAVSKNSFIVNDVNEAFELQADKEVLAFVIGNLLNNAITSSDHVCIRLEAVKQPKGIQIRVKNNGANFYSTVAHSFSEVCAAARSIGGSINIYNQKHEGLVITFSLAA